jgi:putative transposase
VLAALIRPIFNADSQGEARDRLSEAVPALDGRLAKVCELLESAEEDILAFYAFPADHWRKLRSLGRSSWKSESTSRRGSWHSALPRVHGNHREGPAPKTEAHLAYR